MLQPWVLPTVRAAQIPLSLRFPIPFMYRLLNPLVINHFSRSSMLATPSTNPSQEYEVNQILDSKVSRGKLQYMIGWKGFGPERKILGSRF